MDKNFNSFLEKLQRDLIESAPIFFDLVKSNTCKYYDGTSFDWYHRSWQYLRIFNKVSTPTWHIKFYSEILFKYLSNNSKILISGTADYSLLAIVIEVSKRLKIEPDITVIDICPAPLKICQWYAEKKDISITTSVFDVLENYSQIEQSYDVVITDAFLTRFKSEDKLKILNYWNNCIVNKGIIVTTARIDETMSFVEITDTQRKDFIHSVNSIYLESGLKFNVDMDKLSSEYISKIKSFSFNSEDELIVTLKKHNFDIVQFEDALVSGEAKNSRYKRILLKKS